MYFNERECRRAMFNAGIDTRTERGRRSRVSREQPYIIRVNGCSPSIVTCYAIADALGLDNNQFFRVFPRK
jgi:hypothetical protein